MKTHPSIKIITGILITVWHLTPCYSKESDDRLYKPMPERWTYVSPHTQKLPTEDVWWHTFDDTDIDSLIRIAERENYNLGAALSRIEMAKRAMQITKSGYYPTLNLTAGWTKGQSSGASGSTVVNSVGYDTYIAA